MKIEEYRKLIDSTIGTVALAIKEKKVGPEGEKVMAELGITGLVIVGELLMDLKRMADAVERLDADLNK